MNQTEIRKEPRDCFAVLQLFPEPYRQKVRMALESAGGRGVPDRQPLSIGGASHSRQRYTCGLQEIRFRIGRPVLFYIDGRGMVRNGGQGSLQKGHCSLRCSGSPAGRRFCRSFSTFAGIPCMRMKRNWERGLSARRLAAGSASPGRS